MKKLMLGSGYLTERRRREGWVTLDCNPDHVPDVLARIPPMPEAVTSQKWDMVMSSHFVEHIENYEIEGMFREIYGMLAEGGVMVHETPDLIKVCEIILGIRENPHPKYPHLPPPNFGVGTLYGLREPDMSHKWMWEPELLRAEAIKAGFEPDKVLILEAKTHIKERDFRLEAWK